MFKGGRRVCFHEVVVVEAGRYRSFVGMGGWIMVGARPLMLSFLSFKLLMLNVRLFVREGGSCEGASGAQICSPMAAIAISAPQLEHVMAGKMLTGLSPLQGGPIAKDMIAGTVCPVFAARDVVCPSLDYHQCIAPPSTRDSFQRSRCSAFPRRRTSIVKPKDSFDA
jgi:hypothetical protein